MERKNFVIFATDHLGDTLVLYELIYNIRKIYKSVNICLVVYPQWEIIGKLIEDVDKIIVWDKSIKGIKGALKLKEQIGYKQIYATIITFSRQRPIFTAAFLNSKYILFNNINLFFNIFLRRSKYQIEDNREIPISTNVANLLTGITKEEITHVPVKLKEQDIQIFKTIENSYDYICINPIGEGDYKCLTINQLADIVSIFNKHDMPVLILGKGTKAAEYSNKLKQYNLKYLDLINKTSIEEVMSILKTTKCLISVDTGTAHLATYLNIKTLWLANLSQWIPDYLYNNAKNIALNSAPEVIYEETIKLTT